MPTKVICPDCGGRGFREFLWFVIAGNVREWREFKCKLCKGTRKVLLSTWQEKKAKESKNGE